MAINKIVTSKHETRDNDNKLASIQEKSKKDWATNISSAISFSYDAEGARVKTVTNGVTTVYIGNYYEWKTGGKSTKYYRFGGQRVAMRKYTGSPTNTSVIWLHSDHLGSASLATDSNGMPLPNSA